MHKHVVYVASQHNGCGLACLEEQDSRILQGRVRDLRASEMLLQVMTIQQQGREKRRQAEVELANIENQLKNKLLEIRG